MFHEIYTVLDFDIIAPYTLRLRFNDDSAKVINFLPMLRGELYGLLRNLDFFNQVRLDTEAGTLVWPNEADFDPATLHDWDKVGEAMIKMAHSWPEPPLNNNSLTTEKAVQKSSAIYWHQDSEIYNLRAHHELYQREELA
jgi:hypothetical protein